MSGLGARILDLCLISQHHYLLDYGDFTRKCGGLNKIDNFIKLSTRWRNVSQEFWTKMLQKTLILLQAGTLNSWISKSWQYLCYLQIIGPPSKVFFQLMLFSWMVALSACLVWQIISFILPLNKYDHPIGFRFAKWVCNRLREDSR